MIDSMTDDRLIKAVDTGSKTEKEGMSVLNVIESSHLAEAL